jgi:gentisate 1,2-dioxygenase
MITVEYPPGTSDPVHRHNAQALVYVLEGTIVMGVNGEKPITLTAGQTFYEGPNDIHTVGQNASKTMPAKLLVVLLKDKDAPVLIPVKSLWRLKHRVNANASKSKPAKLLAVFVVNGDGAAIPFGNRG